MQRLSTFQNGQGNIQEHRKGVHAGLTYQKIWNVHAAMLEVYSADSQSKDFANETREDPRIEKVAQVI